MNKPQRLYLQAVLNVGTITSASWGKKEKQFSISWELNSFNLYLNYPILNYSSIKSKTFFFFTWIIRLAKNFFCASSHSNRVVSVNAACTHFSRRRPVLFILKSTKCEVSQSMFSSQLCSVNPSVQYRRKPGGGRLQRAWREDAEEAVERSGCNLLRAAERVTKSRVQGPPGALEWFPGRLVILEAYSIT